MNKLLFLTLVVSCVMSALSETNEQEWENYKRKYGITYPTKTEEDKRKEIFLNNLNLIQNHNKKYEAFQTTFKMKTNRYADRTNAEFMKMNGFKKGPRDAEVPEYSASTNEQLPESVDWRSKGAVTAVQVQGDCGSDYAFSTTGSLEGQTWVKNGTLISLSEQNLVDCSQSSVNDKCKGGTMAESFVYIKNKGGIDTEQYYPYTGQESVHCKFSKEHIGATLTGYTNIREGSESDLQSAVSNIGPVSVAIDARQASFHFYGSGIYYESSCSPNALNHGALVVGYGRERNIDYWIVKNSWGTSWGENGYIRIERNRDNNCGIASMASYPNVSQRLSYIFL